MGSHRTKEDDVAKISTSVFITNFPETCVAKDLFNTCKQYGHVVDAFIPFKRSKAGKRFGFVRFINVFCVNRLVSNLCTIWIGKHRLHANVTRFQRPPVNGKAAVEGGLRGFHSVEVNSSKQWGHNTTSNGLKYVNVVKGNPSGKVESVSPSSLVLDDSCLVARELDNVVMGEVRHFSSINNLRVMLHNEGFLNVEISYLGGLWVLIKLSSSKAKLNFMKHVGVASWFVRISNALPDFVAKERIVWVDIEGVPLHAWSRNTFQKIGSKWGEVMELEEGSDEFFARKRLCIKTNLVHNIIESFKIIVKRKVFWVRAKELFVWSPSIIEIPEVGQCFGDDSVKVDEALHGEPISPDIGNEGSDNEVVSDTDFGENDVEQKGVNEVNQGPCFYKDHVVGG
ncbi:RNA-directed DNA polymerase, eukaryota, nucleotide-binding alpha-beta plait domain protein [Tanacetum coccineum]